MNGSAINSALLGSTASARSILQTLQELLADLPRSYSDEAVQHNLSVIRFLGSAEVMLPLLRLALQDDSVLSEIAARSYPHTNHFDKIVLIDSRLPSAYRLTLHLWLPPYSVADVMDEQIHSHRFSFWSRVLAGTLISQNYVRSVDGERYAEFQYSPEKLGVSTVGNFYSRIGPSALRELEPSQLTAGTAYHLFYERIHRIKLPDTSCCTLVLRGPRERSYASVFSNSKRYEPFKHTLLSVSELKLRIRMLTGMIAKQGGSMS